jgi:SpoVK/Ycf46/Vps4 family AAA+-type ATPase
MAVYLARMFTTEITNISYLSNFDLIGQSDLVKASQLKQLFTKAGSTKTSIIILDDIDNIMEMSDTKRGFMFNNPILQALKTLWSRSITNRIIFIVTSESVDLIKDVQLDDIFHQISHLDKVF